MLVAWVMLAGLATVAVSYAVEAARSRPSPPSRLEWWPSVPVAWVDVDGMKLRYLVAGEGPALVLLHTLRTQLDMFRKIVPVLATRFRVYALDLPGHGWSDIPDAPYDAAFFLTAVSKALDRLDLKDAVIVGESIGGSIALLLAARHHPRVRAVAAINPYDYAGGRGIRRSSLLASIIFGVMNVPLLGPTVNRLRSFAVVQRIFRGGLRRSGALPNELAREMYRVGNRPGHGRALAALVRHWGTWEAARVEYRAIERPVLLLYGDHDWSRGDERVADAADIPGAELRVIHNAGHFLSLDAPNEALAEVLEWARKIRAATDGANREPLSGSA